MYAKDVICHPITQRVLGAAAPSILYKIATKGLYCVAPELAIASDILSFVPGANIAVNHFVYNTAYRYLGGIEARDALTEKINSFIDPIYQYFAGEKLDCAGYMQANYPNANVLSDTSTFFVNSSIQSVLSAVVKQPFIDTLDNMNVIQKILVNSGIGSSVGFLANKINPQATFAAQTAFEYGYDFLAEYGYDLV